MTASPVKGLTKRQLLSIPDFEKKINERLPELLDAMLDLALGHHVQISKFDKDAGEVVTNVYLVAPDYKAVAFLIENVIGKVPARVELTGKDGGPVRVIPWMTMDEAVKLGLREEIEGDDGDEGDDSDTVEAEVKVLSEGGEASEASDVEA